MDRLLLRARSGPQRCARCLDDLGAAPWSCPACATALHDECRLESGPCPTLGCSTLAGVSPAIGPVGGVRLALRLAERRGWLERVYALCEELFLLGPPIGLWLLLVVVVPAFDRMFREVGVNLPWSTSLVLDASGWAATWLGATALVGLLALLRRAARTRPSLPGAAFVVALAVAALVVVALFQPLCEITQKL